MIYQNYKDKLKNVENVAKKGYFANVQKASCLGSSPSGAAIEKSTK